MEKVNRTLYVEDQSYQMTFHKIRISNGWKFFVELTNSGQPVLSFDMIRKKKGWSIVPPVPFWVKQKEKELSKIIQASFQLDF